jgi:hypothetical protein
MRDLVGWPPLGLLVIADPDASEGLSYLRALTAYYLWVGTIDTVTFWSFERAAIAYSRHVIAHIWESVLGGVPDAAAPFWGVIMLAVQSPPAGVCRVDSTRIRDKRGEAIRSWATVSF